MCAVGDRYVQHFGIVTHRALPYCPAMLSERPWKFEAVIGLLAGAMMGMLVASLLSMALSHLLSGYQFAQFVINAVCFQVVALVLIQSFLKYHHSSWTELLGLNHARWTTFLRAFV